jgi:periplasmic divalent cation tolerance protein
MTKPSPSDPRLVFVTAPDPDVAKKLARALVGDRLAACASLLPGLTSIYRWDGKVQEESEVLLLIKTCSGRLDDLERRIAELHPYDVPEIVAVEPARVEPRYLAWLQSETRENPET